MMKSEIAALLLGVCAWAFFGECADSGGKSASEKIDFPLSSAEAKRRQVEAARELQVPVEKDFDLGKGVRITMVLIPAGEFMMGSPPGERERSDNEDLHRVTIEKPFWMGKYELTQEQWQAVAGKNPSRFNGAKNPVETASWNDIQGFLEKLNGGQRGSPFALPTEAQWEYACRAGTGTRFCFGDGDDGLGEYAWFLQNSQNTTRATGQKRPNTWGLHDMHGNVWEWCASPHLERYDGSEQKGAEAGGNLRVLRGGSWLYDPRYCRSALRYWGVPEDRTGLVGFRVVRSTRASE